MRSVRNHPVLQQMLSDERRLKRNPEQVIALFKSIIILLERK